MTVSSGAIVAPRAAGHVDELPRAGGHGPAHAQAGHGRAAEGGREAGGGAHHLGGEGGDGAAAKGEAIPEHSETGLGESTFASRRFRILLQLYREQLW